VNPPSRKEGDSADDAERGTAWRIFVPGFPTLINRHHAVKVGENQIALPIPNPFPKPGEGE
jgi:hypothetical protein